MVRPVGSWGVTSFDNDAAGDWFLLVEEDQDPGAVMAAAMDDVLSDADSPEADPCREAIAAAELCASCAGQLAERLPDNVQAWIEENPHGMHSDEVELAVHTVTRIREDSELRDFWDESGDAPQWLAEVDDLLARLKRSSSGSPPAVTP
jgi:hypothetical protein